MTFPPPSGIPGPFGSGDRAPFSPPPGARPPVGRGVGGPVVVHRARLLPRLALLAVIVILPTTIIAIAWLWVFRGDDAYLGDLGAATSAAAPSGADSPGGVAVPEGWPDALRPPEGATVVSAVVTDGGTPEEQMVLVYEVAQDGPAAADALRAQVAAAGLTVSSDSIGPDGSGSLAAAGAGREGTVAVGPTTAGSGVTTVSWVLRVGPR